MLQYLVDKYINKQIIIGTIQKDEINIYKYGYILLLEGLLNILISFILALVLGALKTVLMFSAFFVPLRIFSGGYHAKKTWQCVLISNLVIVIAIFLNKWMLLHHLSMTVYLIINISAMAGIFLISPMESNNKKISVKEKKVYKIAVAVILIFEIAISITFFKGCVWIANISILVNIIQLLNLIFSYLCEKKKRY